MNFVKYVFNSFSCAVSDCSCGSPPDNEWCRGAPAVEAEISDKTSRSNRTTYKIQSVICFSASEGIFPISPRYSGPKPGIQNQLLITFCIHQGMSDTNSLQLPVQELLNLLGFYNLTDKK